MNSNLPGPFIEELCKALGHAFRSEEKLAAMLRTKLDKILAQVASGKDLNDMIFSLIDRAESEGWIDDLIQAAVDTVPRNKLLKQISINYQQFVSPSQPQRSSLLSSSSYVSSDISGPSFSVLPKVSQVPDAPSPPASIRSVRKSQNRSIKHSSHAVQPVLAFDLASAPPLIFRRRRDCS